MKGESLYEVWCEEVRKQSATPILWKYLSEIERTAWNELAKFIEGLVVKGR